MKESNRAKRIEMRAVYATFALIRRLVRRRARKARTTRQQARKRGASKDTATKSKAKAKQKEDKTKKVPATNPVAALGFHDANGTPFEKLAIAQRTLDAQRERHKLLIAEEVRRHMYSRSCRAD